MTKYCIGTINTKFFELLVRKFPKDKIKEIDQILVIIDQNCVKDMQPFKDIVEKYKNVNFEGCEYITHDTIKKYIFQQLDLSDHALKFMYDYELVFKLLLPVYVCREEGDKVLFSDDDVVIPRNPFEYLGDAKYFTTGYHLDKYNEAVSYNREDFEKFKEIFEVPNYTFKDYNTDRSDAGIWLCSYNPDFAVYLKRFLENPHFILRSNNREKMWQRVRLYDQRFLNFYFALPGKNTVYVKPRVDVFRQFVVKWDPDHFKYKAWKTVPYFVHYCASGHKDAFYDYIDFALTASGVEG